jgi:hypothetical protein
MNILIHRTRGTTRFKGESFCRGQWRGFWLVLNLIPEKFGFFFQLDNGKKFKNRRNNEKRNKKN